MGRLTALQRLAALGMVLGVAGILVVSVVRAPDVPFLFDAADRAWIALPLAPSTDLIGSDLERPLSADFSRTFESPQGGLAAFEIEALRGVELRVNGEVIFDAPATRTDWKQRHRVSAPLRPGRNLLRVRVQNPRGPPLLRLKLSGAGVEIATDAMWRVSSAALAPRPAILADDTRRHPNATTVPGPVDGALGQWKMLLGFFALAVVVLLAAREFDPSASLDRLPHLCLAAVALLWIDLFLTKALAIPLVMGFDVVAHLDYVRFLLENRQLPLAHQGWEMGHPPLFYAAVGALAGIFEPETGGIAERIAYRFIPYASGMGTVAIAYLTARTLFERRPIPTAVCVLICGLAPMHLYIATYFSNKSFQTFWTSLALYLAVRAIYARPLRASALLGIGLAAGGALLSEYTGWFFLPWIGVAVAISVWRIHGRGFGHALAQTSAMLGIAFAIAGWFYVRNWLHYGDPWVWNTTLPGSKVWWMQPGFHTAAYYTSFGEALQYPYFSGFRSFWDGIYASFFADAYAAGLKNLVHRPDAWNYDAMSATVLLALPCWGIAIVGSFSSVRAALAGADLRLRVALSLMASCLASVGFAVLFASLRFPFYGQAKAFYGLCALVPLAIVGARGFEVIDDFLASRSRALQIGFWAWFATLVGAIVMAFAA